MRSFARRVTDIFSAPSNKQSWVKYVKDSGWSWLATGKLYFWGQRICPLSWNWSSFPKHKKTPMKTKNRPQLRPQRNVFSKFSHELWLLMLNTEWLRARSGQLCVSIDIKSRICHVPQWVEGGRGGICEPSWDADGAQLTGGWSADGVVGATCKTEDCHTAHAEALNGLTGWVYFIVKHSFG